MTTKMTKMKTGMLGVALMALTVAAAPLPAQQEAPCRCVDADENVIEACRCFRLPDVDPMVARLELVRGRPRLGISLDPAQGERLDAEGVLIREVVEGGPAALAGLQEGDVITDLNGVSLVEPLGSDAERDFDVDESIPVQRLMAMLRDVEPGTEVSIEYRRSGQSRTAAVRAAELPDRARLEVSGPDVVRLRDRMRVLAELPGMRPGGAAPQAFRYRLREAPVGAGHGLPERARALIAWSEVDGLGGLTLVEINPGLGAYFGVEQGVLVANVEPDTPLGLRPGDVVTAIGGRGVATPDRLRRILASYGGNEDIAFDVVRDGDRRSVSGRLPS
jgi:hypothetical protein